MIITGKTWLRVKTFIADSTVIVFPTLWRILFSRVGGFWTYCDFQYLTNGDRLILVSTHFTFFKFPLRYWTHLISEKKSKYVKKDLKKSPNCMWRKCCKCCWQTKRKQFSWVMASTDSYRIMKSHACPPGGLE